MKTVTLGDVAQLIRSKNAGPFLLTLDILFDDRERYEALKASGILSASAISAMYDVDEENVSIVAYDAGLAVKITFPRKVISGSPFDRDVYGAQQHAPLVGLRVPG